MAKKIGKKAREDYDSGKIRAAGKRILPRSIEQVGLVAKAYMEKKREKKPRSRGDIADWDDGEGRNFLYKHPLT